MKHSTVALALIAVAAARPAPFKLDAREVPQEHSHENIISSVNKSLKLSNPDNISDAVFGLLGAAAGIKGAGNIADAGKMFEVKTQRQILIQTRLPSASHC